MKLTMVTITAVTAAMPTLMAKARGQRGSNSASRYQRRLRPSGGNWI